MFKRPLISLIYLLVMLSGIGLLSGCSFGKATGSIPAATTTPAATATPAVTAYTSSDGQYSLQYPDGWTVKALAAQNSSGTAEFGSSGGVAVFIVQPLTIKTSLSYLTLLKDIVGNLAAFHDPKVDSTTTTESYPSGVWTVASATGVISGVPYVYHLYGTVHGGHTVIIYTLVPSSLVASDQAAYFAPMLTSFTFLK